MSAYSGAELIRGALVGGGIGTQRSVTPAGNWPIFVGHMPDSPDNAICVYDIAGLRDGRDMETGDSLGKPGWQIRVRATDHRTGHDKIAAVKAYLDGILRDSVVIGAVTHTIQSVTQTSTILSIGQEPDGKQRSLFTLNGTVTFKVSA